MEIALSAVLMNRENHSRSEITRTVTKSRRHIDQVSRAFDNVEGAIQQAVEVEDAVTLSNTAARSLLTEPEDDCGLVNGFGVSEFVLERIRDFRHAIRNSLDEHRVDSITIRIL